MSDLSSIEMSSVDRPVNRFQVNPVNHKVNEAVKLDVPHEVYRRLVNSNGEPLEDDTFNEDATEILNKQNLQRTQR